MPGQLPLPFASPPRFAEVDFRVAPSNSEAFTWLARTADWPGGRLALWGEPGCGKTHLLHIWAARTGAVLWTAPSLHGLPELPATGGIALDNAEAAADETALFHLLNATNEAGLPLLLASRTPPARWTVRLPDLASRLRAVTSVEIGPPEDALLAALLARLLAERQLRLPDAVRDWLLSRLPRTADALGEAVSRLDAASLQAHRDITVPLAREVLTQLVSGPDDFPATGDVPSPDDPRLL
jgi:DnaA regulatory inactivator Hda